MPSWLVFFGCSTGRVFFLENVGFFQEEFSLANAVCKILLLLIWEFFGRIFNSNPYGFAGDLCWEGFYTSNLPSHCDRQVNDMLAIHHLFVCYYQHWNLDTLPETNIAPENWWLDNDPLLLGSDLILAGAVLVSGRVVTGATLKIRTVQGLYILPALPQNEHPAASGGSTTDL